MFKRAGMLAPDGRCKTLDSAADGYVRGEACASAMLQLMTQDGTSSSAIACILGSAVNQDGRSSSLTAPNGPAQQGVIRQALRGSALQPCDVGTLQMHGTGNCEEALHVLSGFGCMSILCVFVMMVTMSSEALGSIGMSFLLDLGALHVEDVWRSATHVCSKAVPA